jgi:osmoprotectant transport system permease protein
MTTALERPVEKAVRRAPTSSRWSQLASWLTVPVLCLVVLAGLAAYVSGQELDTIEARQLALDKLTTEVVQHIGLSAASTLIVLLLALPLGVAITRSWGRPFAPLAIGLGNIGQAAPAIGVIVLLTLIIGFGTSTAIIALTIYSFLPVLRNTVVGLQQVDRSLIEAGRGMGMTARDVLVRVELRLALPVIAAGVRIALVLNVGVAALAVFIDAGGLGNTIVTGIKLQRDVVLLTGATLTALLALLIDWLAGVAEWALRPRGLR